MAKSEEFDRDGQGDVKKVATKTGPLGLLTIMYIIVSVLIILFVLYWWLT
jgi:hypothetical protein